MAGYSAVWPATFCVSAQEDLKWCSYIYVEHDNSVGADAIAEFGFDKIPLHVWMGEDYYEHDHGRVPASVSLLDCEVAWT